MPCDLEVESDEALSSDQVLPYQVRIRFCAVVPLPKVPVATQNFVLTHEMPFSTLACEVAVLGVGAMDHVLWVARARPADMTVIPTRATTLTEHNANSTSNSLACPGRLQQRFTL